MLECIPPNHECWWRMCGLWGMAGWGLTDTRSRFHVDISKIVAERIQLPDGRYIAYQERGASKETAQHSILVVHGFLSSRHAGRHSTQTSYFCFASMCGIWWWSSSLADNCSMYFIASCFESRTVMLLLSDCKTNYCHKRWDSTLAWFVSYIRNLRWRWGLG